MNTILGPPDHLTKVIGSGSKAVVSSRKRQKPSHLVVLPHESEVDIADVVRRAVETCAAPSLSERFRIGGLRNAHEDALSILHVPRDTTVRSAKCAEVGEQAASPQRSVPIPVRQPGITCCPALIIDAVPAATCATKIG